MKCRRTSLLSCNTRTISAPSFSGVYDRVMSQPGREPVGLASGHRMFREIAETPAQAVQEARACSNPRLAIMHSPSRSSAALGAGL